MSTGMQLFKARLRQLGLEYVDFRMNTLTIQASKRIPNAEYYQKLHERILQYIKADAVVATFFTGLTRVDIRNPETPEKPGTDPAPAAEKK
ncbi:MAG: hypothetical protein JOZ38_11825 [Candidatus Eremiobacteraeota bacterium]|nr:hypothetical protein [Candidatus Eremiobacteraeota bacterium]